MEPLVKSCNICRVLSGMPGHVRARACPRFSKITKQQYLWKGLTYSVYSLHVVTHPLKLQCYRVILVWYCPAVQSWSNKSPISLEKVEWFCWFLQVAICILLDIRWSYKNMLFWSGIVRHSPSDNQIVTCFKLKKLKKDMRYQVDFLLPLKLEEILCCFGLWLQNTIGE